MLAAADVSPQRCTRIANAAATGYRTGCRTASRFFPASVPIYRGNTLVGALGVSGDGIDQDDMIAFLGLSQWRRPSVGNRHRQRARRSIRADQIVVALSNSPGVRLRYVSCPFAPFLDTSEQQCLFRGAKCR